MEDLFIKAATVIAVGLATFSSFPSTAQQDTATQKRSVFVQQTSPSTNPKRSSLPNSDNAAPKAVAEKLKPVSGELVNRLDAKSAKKSDSVMVKTDQNVTISAGTRIQRGSRPFGHVTNVQP